jgi:hypothetical protein
LIKRGVVVTAAHCVAAFGTKRFYKNWQFIPGQRKAGGLGVWTVQAALVLPSYLDGTDSCAVVGIVCQDDVAVLLLSPHGADYPGTSLGWYGYGWNGYGFTNGLTQITQIGYPACLDGGKRMQRNESYGYTSAGNSDNTVIGSLMCGGSSGGPWLVNFGKRPTATGATAGTARDPNVVVGVTSWGYVSSLPKEQGASPFTSDNIVPLVDAACAIAPVGCEYGHRCPTGATSARLDRCGRRRSKPIAGKSCRNRQCAFSDLGQFPQSLTRGGEGNDKVDFDRVETVDCDGPNSTRPAAFATAKTQERITDGH